MPGWSRPVGVAGITAIILAMQDESDLSPIASGVDAVSWSLNAES